MRPDAEELPAEGVIRCEACDDVIGVYEPLVHVVDGLARQTSRAAEPGIRCSAARCYHVSCHRGLEDRL